MPKHPTKRRRSRITTSSTTLDTTAAPHQPADAPGLPRRQLSLARGGDVEEVLQVGQRVSDVEDAHAKARLEQELDVLVQEEEGVLEAEARDAARE